MFLSFITLSIISHPYNLTFVRVLLLWYMCEPQVLKELKSFPLTNLKGFLSLLSPPLCINIVSTFLLRLPMDCVCVCVCVCVFSHSVLTPWTVAHQAPLSMGFSRQEYWGRLPFSSSGDLPNLGIKPVSPVSPSLAGRLFTTEPQGKPIHRFDLFYFSLIRYSIQFSSVAQSCPTLWCHESLHARPPCPSPTPRIHSNSHPLSRWCQPAISSSVVPFSSCPQSLLASESFPSTLRWPKYWSFSFSIIPSKEQPGLISSRMDWLDLLVV